MRNLLIVFGLFGLNRISSADEPVRFNRDMRPILSDHCFPCRGPDGARGQMKLRLDGRDSALARGAIVPGRSAESELVARITTADAEARMPPPDSHKKLTASQITILKRWIDDGAVYEPHWAYGVPARPPLPGDGHPIDAFIRDSLARLKIDPSPPADPRTLARRLSLDLTGLPPTPERVEAFAADPSPARFLDLVDELLASPHYGERMAVPWLDVVRFSDTVGYHGDQNANIFPYRDYVIDSFNQNKTFDRFTIEQLAGDLLPDAGDEQLIATGFNRLNMMTREGGAQPREYLAKYAADRVRTVSTTWLGATMGCAECHDHKFDPITAHDFYSMAAFFSDIKQWGVYSEYTYTPNPALRGFTNDHPFPPEQLVENAALKRTVERLRGAIRELAARATVEPGWFDPLRAWLSDHPDGWMVPPADCEELTAEPDGSIRLDNRGKDVARKIRITPPAGRFTAVRLELLPPVCGAIVNATFARRRDGRVTMLPIEFADANFKQPRYRSGLPLLGLESGWRTDNANAGQPHVAVFLFDGAVEVRPGDEWIVTLQGDNGARVRVGVSKIPFADPARATIDESLRSAVNSGDRELALRGAADPSAYTEYKRLARELRECRHGRAFTLVTEAWEPRPVRVLPRGNWMDESGELVSPAVPEFLGKLAIGDRRPTRLDLARWLVADENPLTARVFVNRLWHQFFGNGLSNVLDDLGTQGEPPSHPELLDWLAVEFRESGWDVKHLVRLIVTSATYQQSSNGRPDLRDTDPANRTLAMQSPRRLDAEFIRDAALFASGLLNEEVGGPSAKPYQPAGYYENLQFPDRNYVAATDGRQHRRGVYVHWQRTFLHPMLANFDPLRATNRVRSGRKRTRRNRR